MGWGPNLGGVRGACAPGNLVQLRDQHEQEVGVEAPSSTHTARHSQHLPKGASGLWNTWPVQAQAQCRRDKDAASDTRNITDACDSAETLLPLPHSPARPPTGRSSRGQSLSIAGRSHLPPVPPARVRPRPSAPTAAAPAPARSRAGSDSGCATARPPPWGHGVPDTGSVLGGAATSPPAGGRGQGSRPPPATSPQSWRNTVSGICADHRAGPPRTVWVRETSNMVFIHNQRFNGCTKPKSQALGWQKLPGSCPPPRSTHPAWAPGATLVGKRRLHARIAAPMPPGWRGEGIRRLCPFHRARLCC